MQIFKVKRSFKKELRRQIRLAVVAGIGFTIAFAWRNAIYKSAYDIVEKFTSSTHFILTEILTAIFITLLAIAVLFITSKILKE